MTMEAYMAGVREAIKRFDNCDTEEELWVLRYTRWFRSPDVPRSPGILAEIRSDSLAQIMAVMPHTRNCYTYAAVSPKARLYAEVSASSGQHYSPPTRKRGAPSQPRWKLTTKVSNEGSGLVFEADPTNLEQMQRSLWWAEKCTALPIELTERNTAANLVALRTAVVKARLTCLDVSLDEAETAPAESTDSALASDSQGSASSLLEALSAFPLLLNLRVRGQPMKSGAAAAAVLTRGLAAAQTTQIATLYISDCPFLEDLSPIAGAAHLRVLGVSSCGVHTLGDLKACPLLELVTFFNCGQLRSVSGLAGAPCLEHLEAQQCGVDSLAGLEACPALEILSILRCRNLTNISVLSGMKSLKCVNFSCTNVNDLTALRSCTSLEIVNVAHCEGLRDISPLFGAANLQFLDASGTEVSDIGGLASCPLLEGIKLCSCFGIDTLTPLAGAAKLKQIDVSDGRVRDISALSTFPLLEDVELSGCEGVKTCEALSGAVRLKHLGASRTDVCSLDALASLSSLEAICVASCDALTSLAPLAGLPRLRVISAEYSAVSDLRGIELCPVLTHVNLNGCSNITNLANLLEAPRLSALCLPAHLCDEYDEAQLRQRVEHVTFGGR